MVGFNKYSGTLTGADYAVAGAASGFVTRALCQPFDVLKIRFQLQVEPIRKTYNSKYQSITQAILTIGKEEGITAFWKGHVPAQILSVIFGLTQFWVFEELTRSINRVYPDVKNKAAFSFICGSAAGVSATVVSFPFDVLRTRLIAQSEAEKIYSGIFHASKQMYKTEGPIVFFRGLLPTIIQVAPHVGIQFMCYNVFDSIYRHLRGMNGNVFSLSSSAIAGSLAGLCAKTAVYPFDLMRKRLQVQGIQEKRKNFGQAFVCTSLTDCFKSTFKQEGFSGLFKGLSPSLIKAVASTAMHFSCYEFICKIIASSKI